MMYVPRYLHRHNAFRIDRSLRHILEYNRCICIIIHIGNIQVNTADSKSTQCQSAHVITGHLRLHAMLQPEYINNHRARNSPLAMTKPSRHVWFDLQIQFLPAKTVGRTTVFAVDWAFSWTGRSLVWSVSIACCISSPTPWTRNGRLQGFSPSAWKRSASISWNGSWAKTLGGLGGSQNFSHLRWNF